jgi:hypothetical protein
MDEDMSKLLPGRPIMFDVDSTLVFDPSDLPDEQRAKAHPTTVHCFGRNIQTFPHRANMALMEKLYNRGYTILVHSHSGGEWAQAVCLAYGLDPLVTQYQTKGQYYVDDLPVEQWYGERVYRPYEP